LDQAWSDATRPVWAEVAGPADLDARIQVEVTGGPERSVDWHAVVEGGRLVASGPGVLQGTDVTFTVNWDDALALVRGSLDPAVAFMQGRLKVSGSMAVVLALLPVTRTAAYARARDRVAELTIVPG
jgi:hypothetical protein